MYTTSDVCFPLEILYEFILQSSSSPSTLAAWCSVSRSLLAFAGPLLYRTVSLKRSEDVIPFLGRLRLARSSSPPPPSSLLLLPFVKGIQRLEILALPLDKDLLELTKEDPSVQTRSDLVLALNWEGQVNERENQMASFFVPRLLLEVHPVSYEEIGRENNTTLPPVVLELYLTHLSTQTIPSFLSAERYTTLECDYTSLVEVVSRFSSFNRNARPEASGCVDFLFQLPADDPGAAQSEVLRAAFREPLERMQILLGRIDARSPFRDEPWESLERMLEVQRNVQSRMDQLEALVQAFVPRILGMLDQLRDAVERKQAELDAVLGSGSGGTGETTE